MTVIVRPLVATDRDRWQSLWDAYCEFYETSMPVDVTEITWRRLLAEDEPTYFGLVAELDGNVIGIANCILHFTTWAIEPRCYLNDLFVDPAARGHGVARALIQEIQHMAATNGWNKVHWLTHETNRTARRLYDSFQPATGFVQYAIPPQEKP